jgi:hypothetical protein
VFLSLRLNHNACPFLLLRVPSLGRLLRGTGETRSTALVQKDLFIYGFEIIYPLSKLL